MDFLKLLKSFEDFIFEATSWLVFYPLTIWRVLVAPLEMMAASDREQTETLEHQYDDALSPPLLLLVTLVIMNGVATAFHVPQSTSASHLSAYLTSAPQNLILFRSLLFSLPPLVAATTLLRRQGRKLTRESLRAPFYAQCYLAAPTAIFVSTGFMIEQRPDLPDQIGAAIVLVGAIWFLTVQTLWFRRRLAISYLKAALTAVWALIRAVAYTLAILIPVALI